MRQALAQSDQGTHMSALETTEHVQFTVDQTGKITAVVVPPDLWQRIVAALEDAEDHALVQALHSRLTEGPAASGALRWQDVADQWQ
jgi:hypothetical protein